MPPRVNHLSSSMGALIGAAIDDEGMSQADFARLVGCSPKHLNTVIMGRTSATPAMLEYWAFVLGRKWSVRLEKNDA